MGVRDRPGPGVEAGYLSYGTRRLVARERTRLTLHDNGDGTTSGHSTVPTLAASILRKALDAMTAPRRSRLGAPRAQAATRVDRDWAYDRGLAFTDLLEHLPTDRLHGKVAATVVVTLDLETLRGQLKAASLDSGDLVSRCRGAPARVPGGTGPRSARRHVPAARPRTLQPTVHRGAAGRRRHPPHQLRRRRLRGAVRLVRAPPPTALEHERSDRPGRHGAAVRVPPPPDPRPRTPAPKAAGRIDPLHPADVSRVVREARRQGRRVSRRRRPATPTRWRRASRGAG